VRRSRKYECKSRDKPEACAIDKIHRNQCRSCRLRKCLEAGMNREGKHCLHVHVYTEQYDENIVRCCAVYLHGVSEARTICCEFYRSMIRRARNCYVRPSALTWTLVVRDVTFLLRTRCLNFITNTLYMMDTDSAALSRYKMTT